VLRSICATSFNNACLISIARYLFRFIRHPPGLEL
jgi:hypothetical protein